MKIAKLAVIVAAALLTPLPAAQAQSADSGSGAVLRTTASPGTEAWLLRYIASVEKSGQPNYEDMAPGLANAARAQLKQMLENHQKLGAFKSLAFKSVGPGGADIYEAVFANGRAAFNIAPLQADGKAAGLQFRVLPTPAEEAAIKQRIADGKPDPEREALLRQNIAAEQKGDIGAEIKTPTLVAAYKQQWSARQQTNMQLGKFVSLTFVHVNELGWDVYDATYEKGRQIWRVGPLMDHKLHLLLVQPPP